MLPPPALPPWDAMQSLHRHLLFSEESGPSSESLKLDFLSLVHRDFACLFSVFFPFPSISSFGISVLPGWPTHGVRLISNAQSPRKTIPRFFWLDAQPVTTINTAKQKTTPNINIVLWGCVFDTSTSLSDKNTVAIIQKRHGSQAKNCPVHKNSAFQYSDRTNNQKTWNNRKSLCIFTLPNAKRPAFCLVNFVKPVALLPRQVLLSASRAVRPNNALHKGHKVDYGNVNSMALYGIVMCLRR